MKIPTWVFSIPYIDGGRSAEGADCWGLVIVLYKELYDICIEEYGHIILPSLEESSRTSEKLREVLSQQEMFKQVDSPDFGDVILLNVKGEPLHIGVCLDKQTMMHTTKHSGVVIENFMEIKWKHKIAGFYRQM